jgi:hypothetical protein
MLLCLFFKKIAEQKVPEQGISDVDVQTKGENKIIVHQEKDGEKKRKRAHEDDVRNNLSSNSNNLKYLSHVDHCVQNLYYL